MPAVRPRLVGKLVIFFLSLALGVLHTHFYNHVASALTVIYIGLARSSNGYFKPLLDPGPGGDFASETAAGRF